ncbi:unnamed protein product [Gadus morhua 'NCC']
MKTFALVFVFLILAAVCTDANPIMKESVAEQPVRSKRQVVIIILPAPFRGPRPGGAHNVTRRTHDDNEDDDEESKTSARFYVGLFPCRPISSDSL